MITFIGVIVLVLAMLLKVNFLGLGLLFLLVMLTFIVEFGKSLS